MVLNDEGKQETDCVNYQITGRLIKFVVFHDDLKHGDYFR